MRIYTCEDRYDAIATCIYDAWEWALKNGHENVRLQKEPVLQPGFFAEYIHVEPDPGKARKVTRSIRQKISEDAYATVYFATLYQEDLLNEIYQYLRIGFRVGPAIREMLTEPVVMKLMQARRNVGNEISAVKEFTRFDEVSGVLVSHMEPKNNVLYLGSTHFADRMPSENWMMIDDVRRLAVIHPKDTQMYIQYLEEEEWNRLKETENKRDIYRNLWETFFEAIAIEERKNPTCQRNHFPLWRRKHVTEFR